MSNETNSFSLSVTFPTKTPLLILKHIRKVKFESFRTNDLHQHLLWFFKLDNNGRISGRGGGGDESCAKKKTLARTFAAKYSSELS